MKSSGPQVIDETLMALVLEEFTDQLNRGEHPSVEEYFRRYPDLAEQLRQVLPAVVLMGHLDDASSASAGSLEDALDESVADDAPHALGDFRILRELGRGGMGVVYEAEQLSLKRRVALKILPFAAVLDPRQLQRFKNEALAAAQLEHPHIVPVYGVGCDRGVHHFAMRFIEGRTLESVIQQLRQRQSSPEPIESPSAFSPASQERVAGATQPDESGTHTVPPDTAPLAALTTQAAGSGEFFRAVAGIGRDMAHALDYAHENGVIHRDVKPANILIDAAGKAWITDFGLARIETEHSLTLSGDLLGTLRYMSPEQVLGKRAVIDHRSDVYSLGATLYELLTLTPAVPGNDRAELLNHIASEEPRYPQQVNAAIPTDLSTIVLKSLAKLPEERYDTAADLAADLQRFLNHEPIRARPPTLHRRITKWSIRHRPFVTGLTTMLLFSTLALTVATALISRARTKAVNASQELQSALNDNQRMLNEKNVALSEKQAALEEKTVALVRETATARNVYPLNIAAASNLINDRNYELARELLGQYKDGAAAADRRGFEWHYLWGLANGTQARRLRGHTDVVFSVCFSPDSRRVATASRDYSFCLWDVETGQRLWQNAVHTNDVNCAAFSPDGQIIATASDDHTVALWDAETGGRQTTLLGHVDMVPFVDFSPDGRLLVSASIDGEIRTWNRETGRPIATVDAMNSQDGKLRSLAISPDGATIATGADDHIARVWKLPTLEPVFSTKVSDAVESIAFDASSERLLTATRSGWLTFLDTRTGEQLQRFTAGQDILHIARRRGSDRWAVSSGFRSRGVRVWSDPQRPAFYSHGGGTSWGVAFSPDGRYLAAGCDHDVVLWDLRRPPAYQTLAWYPSGVTCLATVPNREIVIVGTDAGDLQLLDLVSGREFGNLPGHAGGVTSMYVSRDGKTLVTGGNDEVVRIYDAPTLRESIVLTGFAGPIQALDISVDLDVLAVLDGTRIKTFHRSTWGAFTEIEAPDVNLFRFTFNRHSLRGSSRYSLQYFTPDAQIVPLQPLLRDSRPQSLDVTVDGTEAAAGFQDGSVLFYDIERAHADDNYHGQSALDQHSAAVIAAAFNRDQKTLATGDSSGEVILWGVETKTVMLKLNLEMFGNLPDFEALEQLSLDFTWDGSALIAGGTYRTTTEPPGTAGFVFAWYGDPQNTTETEYNSSTVRAAHP